MFLFLHKGVDRTYAKGPLEQAEPHARPDNTFPLSKMEYCMRSGPTDTGLCNKRVSAPSTGCYRPHVFHESQRKKKALSRDELPNLICQTS